jgi:hypothetical protein
MSGMAMQSNRMLESSGRAPGKVAWPSWQINFANRRDDQEFGQSGDMGLPRSFRMAGLEVTGARTCPTAEPLVVSTFERHFWMANRGGGTDPK